MPCVVSEAFKEASKGVSGGFRGNLGDFGWTSEGFRELQGLSRKLQKVSEGLLMDFKSIEKTTRKLSEELQRGYGRVSRRSNKFQDVSAGIKGLQWLQ